MLMLAVLLWIAMAAISWTRIVYFASLPRECHAVLFELDPLVIFRSSATQCSTFVLFTTWRCSCSRTRRCCCSFIGSSGTSPESECLSRGYLFVIFLFALRVPRDRRRENNVSVVRRIRVSERCLSHTQPIREQNAPHADEC